MPRALRVLIALLVTTAAATVVVEILNYSYAPEHGFGLAVRTGWALLRTLGWLLLIRQVRRSRAAARPLGLILAVTTIFAVGRLVVPREGVPPRPGVIGFAVLVVLCVTVVALLYRHPAAREHLVRHPNRLVLTREGLSMREAAPRRAPVAGWLLTARLAAFTYSPLMLVPCLIAFGELRDRPQWLLAVVFWLFAGIAVSYAVLLCTIFLMRGKAGARRALGWLTFFVLLWDLPLCYFLLGTDGLIRDGAPLLAAALLTWYALYRAAAVADIPAEVRT
ncbi:hypothetical protein [Paractinoplanes atraurantiacus]|uniref:Uncharacterized protein n=1 Tax=Paractinoplanes atraurantiacus TaxID=1036182 RepID=A0A285F495_9ACTN|nr:hypothetical protein [Actinoplanes atraurantiacus]SNY06119.1 hypothetical protein SAMN05421748_101630 [Actinoplanes atraurantiacus]